ncbi:MAG: hypothetical protein CME70_07090 [Halobacteriovorax sp.]|nr:hypothetical protein [Halobacteriovorax sp.]|tara:strand:- start:423691 stop:425316 length:1626 start_codon:yes stop_codon:yes gene_type:complete
MKSVLKIDNLLINNFATIKNQSIDFSNGFNVIVGETGSGKSLILDALQLTFGARAEKKLVRKDCDFSTVEVSFSIEKAGYKKIKKFCDELGFPFEESIHIKRVIYKEGNSKAFLNHQACPLNILTKFTRKFIDLVGQFENQKLLTPEYQLKLLDSFARIDKDFKKFADLFSTFKNLGQELQKLEGKIENREREIDYLEFQLSEFDTLNPSTEEEERLIAEKNSMLNMEKIESSSNEFRYLTFEENDGGFLSRFKSVVSKITGMALEDSEVLENKVETIENALYEIDELLRAKSNSIQDSESRIEEILDLLDRYQKLKRKFNLPTEELRKKRESLNDELSALKSIETSINEFKKKIVVVKEQCLNLALTLHKDRASAAANLSKELTRVIQKLNMEGASIKFNCEEVESLSSNGLTKLELLAETNPGEGFYNLSKIASGGELSRILLSLRHLMTTQDSISVFLFDEIDTGIGGKTALKIGEMLKEISSCSQVIAITHLPQIASFSNNLIAVEKKTISSRTESKVSVLSRAQIKEYVNQMASLN